MTLYSLLLTMELIFIFTRARPLDDTLVLVDDSVLCHLSGGLNEEDLAKKSQNAICSDESELIDAMQKNTHKILTRSNSYLK